MKKTIAKVVAFTMLVATLTSRDHSNSVSMESTAAPEKIQTEGATSEAVETKEEGAGAASYKFASFPNTQNSTFQAVMNDAFKKLCDEKGHGYARLDPDYDLNTQSSQMADVATQDLDVVSVIPVDSVGIRQSLEQIHEKSILILNADTPVIDDNLDLVETVTATDAYDAGILVGQQTAADYLDGAKIAILGFPSSESCVNRVAGFLDGLGDAKDKSDIVAQQDGAAVLDIFMPIVEDTIQANPDSNAFSCISDPSALGAAAATKTSGKTGIGAYSIDTSPDGKAAIPSGSFTAVTVQVPIGIVETAFKKAEELLTGGKIEREILLLSFLADKEKAEVTLKDWQ